MSDKELGRPVKKNNSGEGLPKGSGILRGKEQNVPGGRGGVPGGRGGVPGGRGGVPGGRGGVPGGRGASS
jgi:hypothetical protein